MYPHRINLGRGWEHESSTGWRMDREMIQISRRALLVGQASGLSSAALLAARPKGYLVENAIHLFAADQKRFPFHPNATYRPKPLTLESYAAFAREAKIDHTVIVHSEVYQDDYRSGLPLRDRRTAFQAGS